MMNVLNIGFEFAKWICLGVYFMAFIPCLYFLKGLLEILFTSVFSRGE